MLKTPVKPSYSLVGDLHGMQGVSGSSPLGSIMIFANFYQFSLRFKVDLKKS